MSVNLHVDLETLQLIQGPGQRSAVAALRFKRGDAARLQVVFLDNGLTPVAIGNSNALEIQIGIKPRNQFDHSYLAHCVDWSMPSEGDDTPTYECFLSFNTLQLNSALNIDSPTGDELAEITLMGEITWREGMGEPSSTRTFLVVVENDVNRGTEGVPNDANPFYPPPQGIEMIANKGIANGYAPLDANGKVPTIHVPGTTTATPETLVQRDAQGGGVSFGGGCVFTDPRVGGQNVTIISTGGSNDFDGDPTALSISATGTGTGASISTSGGSGVGAFITSSSGAGALVQSSTGTGAIISSYSGTGAAISSLIGPHLNVGIGKFVVTNNGNASFTGNVTAPNLVTNNGANSFAIRPTSAGPILAYTSLITQADGYYQNILNPLKVGELDTRPLAQYYSESATAGYALVTNNYTLEITAPEATGSSQNSFYNYKLSDSIFKEAGNRWNYARGCEMFMLFEMQVNSLSGTRHQIAICSGLPNGQLEQSGNFGLAIEVFNEGGFTKLRLIRKTSVFETASFSSAFSLGSSGKFIAMWLKITAAGAVELRVVGTPSFTTFPNRPATAQLTLAAANYDPAPGSIFLTGLATSATAAQNAGTVRFHKLHYHIDT
jgi:hypothetical protein